MRFENIITKFQFSLTMNSDMNVFFVTCGSQTPSSNNRYIGTCGTWELELQIFLTKIDFAPSLESAVILNQILSRQYKYQNIKICLQISSGGIANKEYWSTLQCIGFWRILYLSICTRQCIWLCVIAMELEVAFPISNCGKSNSGHFEQAGAQTQTVPAWP